jgi:hypothetical protein
VVAAPARRAGRREPLALAMLAPATAGSVGSSRLSATRATHLIDR